MKRLLLTVLSSIAFQLLAVADGRPNVLFFVIDDLRPALGCYGEKTYTLNIDGLANKSVLFNQAFVQQAICGPSRVSFLTSRRPDTTRLYDFYSYWRVHAGNYTTLPQHFKEHGYITQSVGKVFHPGKASNFSDDSPYSWTNKPYHPPTQQYKMAKVCPNPDGTLAMNINCPVDVEKMPGKSLPDIQSADFAVNFLKNMSESNSSQPFFLAVGFHKPHVPMKYPKEYLDLYPLSQIQLAKYHTYPLRMPLVAWNPWTDVRERDDAKKLNMSFPFGPVPDHFQRLMRQNYYAATSYMDAQVGRVLAALDDQGFADDTIISFVGDHGWALGEHQEWSKYSLFDVAVKVPLLLYIPGVTHSRKQKDEKVFPFLDVLSIRKPTPNSVQPSFDDFEVDRSEILSKSLRFKSENREYEFESESFFASRTDSVENIGSALSDNTYQKTQSSSFAKYTSSALVELVDLFPTLAEAAGLTTLPLCPENPFKTRLCTEGASLYSLIKNITQENKGHGHLGRGGSTGKESGEIIPKQEFSSGEDEVSKCVPSYRRRNHVKNFAWKNAVFSQYPRPSVEPRENSDKPHLKDIRIMGYSMWTVDFHYTEWVGFDPGNYSIHWDQVFGRELYLRQEDQYEIHNLAMFERCVPLVRKLSGQLHVGWRGALPTQINSL